MKGYPTPSSTEMWEIQIGIYMRKKNLNSKPPLFPKYLAELNGQVDHVTTSLNHSLEPTWPKPRYEEIT